jgi:exoribonuclease II
MTSYLPGDNSPMPKRRQFLNELSTLTSEQKRKVVIVLIARLMRSIARKRAPVVVSQSQANAQRLD